jgi:hypothetical protein
VASAQVAAVAAGAVRRVAAEVIGAGARMPAAQAGVAAPEADPPITPQWLFQHPPRGPVLGKCGFSRATRRSSRVRLPVLGKEPEQHLVQELAHHPGRGAQHALADEAVALEDAGSVGVGAVAVEPGQRALWTQWRQRQNGWPAGSA